MRNLRKIAICVVTIFGSDAAAQSVTISAGNLECSKVRAIADGGSQSERDLLYGWISGFWSAATLFEGDDFDRIIGESGADTLYEATVNACRQNELRNLHNTATDMLNDLAD